MSLKSHLSYHPLTPGGNIDFLISRKEKSRMKVRVLRSNRGFSLVELLAVVLILAVLAAVAVPLYLNTRKTSAARACKANINAIASAEAAYALRNGAYADMATLAATGPESLSSTVKCPLDNADYNL